MSEKIYTLTLNPCFDTTLNIDNLSLDVCRVKDEFTQPRGKGVNVSIALKKLKISSKALILVGRENSAKYLNALALELDDYKVFETSGTVRENFTITDEIKQIKINRKGDSVDEASLKSISNYILNSITNGDYLIISGSLPAGISEKEFEEFCISVGEKTKLILDVESINLDTINNIKPWMMKPNIHELNGLLGTNTVTKDEIVKAVAASNINSEIICVTAGSMGALCYTQNRMVYCKAPATKVSSSVSSGDSFIAGFVAAYLVNKSIEQCLQYAVAFGSATAELKGTNIAEKERVDYLSNIT